METLSEQWFLDCEIAQRSPATLAFRRLAMGKLLWFLHERGKTACGGTEAREFLAHVATGHTTPEGRFGNPRLKAPPEPRTVQAYSVEVRSFFRWCVRQGYLAACPVENIPIPTVRHDQVRPFTPEQVEALLRAARSTPQARRDEALVLFLLDTGARASEVCSLRRGDVNWQARSVVVKGKGDKTRTVCFSPTTARCLFRYLAETPGDDDDPLFAGKRGQEAGGALTRSGLLKLITRLGQDAGLAAVRCSPHTFRHTFAVEFLRDGGNTFTLQQILGHTTLAMTNRYVAFAQADIERQHRQHSPVERLRRGGKGR